MRIETEGKRCLISSEDFISRIYNISPGHWTCSFVCHFNSTESIIVLQPFQRIELSIHIATSVLPGTHLHLSQTNLGSVKCLAQGHDVPTLKGGRHDNFLKTCTKEELNSHGRMPATMAKRNALTITPHPSL